MGLSKENIKNLFHYWWGSLADEDLMGLKDAGGAITAFACVVAGRLDKEQVKKIYKAWQDSKRDEPTSVDLAKADRAIGVTQEIAVTILAKGFVRKRAHGIPLRGNASDAIQYTFFVPALLSQDGTLMCPQEGTPWIGREFLEPVETTKDDLPVIGDLNVFDAWLEKHRLPENAQWQDYIAWCGDLWAAVAVNNEPEGFVGIDDVAVGLSDSFGAPARHIRKLYEALIEQDNLPLLLQQICLGQSEHEEITDALRIGKIGAPRGTMSISYGLAASQSDAVAAYSDMLEGELLAVNGPPGTGKTTLLQSIIATEVVTSALVGENPSVIVGASTNNQAVTNINKSLNDALNKNPATTKYPWARRWVPNVESYGLYLPAESKAEEAQKNNFKVALGKGSNWSGLPELEKDAEYILVAKQLWMASFEGTFRKKPESLEAGLMALQGEIKELVRLATVIQSGIEALEAVNRWWRETVGDLSPKEFIVLEERRLEACVKQVEEQLHATIAVLEKLSTEKEAVLDAHEMAAQETQKIIAEKEARIRQLNDLKAKIFAAMEPQGIIEHVYQLVFFLRKYLIGTQNARLCALAARDAYISRMFAKEAVADNPAMWQRRAAELQRDALQRFDLTQKAEARKAEERKKEYNAIDYKYTLASERKVRAQSDLQTAVSTKNMRLGTLQGKLDELLAHLKNLQSIYNGLAAFVDADALVPAERYRLTKKEPTTEDFNWILDITYRHKAFQLALRYWEGRWISEVEEIQLAKDKDKRLKAGKIGMEARFRRWCMLTPCLVSTLHSLPRHFRYKNALPAEKNDNQEKQEKLFYEDHLLGFIDLLIMDEAGQVGPHIGAAAFALAKKAVVVGDVFQIEPISKISIGTDYANSVNDNLAMLWDRGDHASPLLVSEPKEGQMGSVMRLAHEATAFSSEGAITEAGVFLSEHRRCRDEIIKYCNKLVYHGRLVPMSGKREKTPPVPPLAWGHVQGEVRKSGGSQGNEKEAAAIAQWIANNAEKWCQHYGMSIEKIVTVITPFRYQKRLIENALSRMGQHKKILVGTIHGMQGAECPIVIFSPTYSADKTQGLFFDRKPNMLNVAVSRAQDTFVVIGDMRLFHKKGLTPSAVLGDCLFEEEFYELTELAKSSHIPQTLQVQGERIADLNRHREILHQAIANAERGQKIVIASPWITLRTIENDHLDDLIRAAVQERSAEVHIIVDKDLSLRDVNYKGQEAIARLTKAGARVTSVEKMHNKSLIVDNTMIVEGSFNWLSAARAENSAYQRYEVSWAVSGEASQASIHAALDDFRRLGAPV